MRRRGLEAVAETVARRFNKIDGRCDLIEQLRFEFGRARLQIDIARSAAAVAVGDCAGDTDGEEAAVGGGGRSGGAACRSEWVGVDGHDKFGW